MANISNEEVINKAVIVANDLASAGKLNDAQSNRFIDYTIDETVLKQNARIVRFRNESLVIDKIGVGRRVAMPKAEAVDPGQRRGITTSKITLTPKEFCVPFEIGDNFRELNIEGDDVEDHIIRMMATQLGNDIEDLCINGNTLGPAALEGDIIDGGSATQYVQDSYLALTQGWSVLADASNIVDAEGGSIGLSIFSRAIRALPTKFRRNMTQLRFFMSPDLYQLYKEKLSSRATSLGDSVATGGGSVTAFGIPIVPVPLWQFEPVIVEHVTLTGTTAVALKNGPITDVVVTPSTLGKTATPAYINVTDYVVDLSAGTIARDSGGAIGSGDVVKVTYRASPQMLLTHMNNFVVGIGRDIRIERDREIYKGVNQYAISGKVAVQFEEASAIVKVKNVGLAA